MVQAKEKRPDLTGLRTRNNPSSSMFVNPRAGAKTATFWGGSKWRHHPPMVALFPKAAIFISQKTLGTVLYNPTVSAPNKSWEITMADTRSPEQHRNGRQSGRDPKGRSGLAPSSPSVGATSSTENTLLSFKHRDLLPSGLVWS